MARSAGAEDLGIRPLTARSVLLSALLGTDPPRLRAAQLVRAGAMFDLSEGAVRTAMSRMAAVGDVSLRDGRYELSTRLSNRRHRQDRSRGDLRRAWDGRWSMVVVVAERRRAAERAELRHAMGELRLVELREGVWVRPDNHPAEAHPVIDAQCERWRGEPRAGPSATASRRLWDLPGWTRRARALLQAFGEEATPARRFTVSAATLHHLLTDPMLPDELLPDDWPGTELRRRFDRFYADHQAELARYLRASGRASREAPPP